MPNRHRLTRAIPGRISPGGTAALGSFNQKPCADASYNPAMLWPDEKRTRYAAIRERMTRAEGKRMRCIRGAKAAHQAMRLKGRTPGDEGRAAIAANREARRRDAEQGKGWRYGQTDMSGV